MISSASRKDLVVATLVLLSVAGELALRELYYRFWAELPGLLLVGAAWLAILLTVLWFARPGRSPRFDVVSRVGLFVSFAFWLDIFGDAVSGLLAAEGTGRELVHAVGFACFASGAWWALRVPPMRWAAIRRAVCAVAVLFVASQPIVAAIHAPTIAWPGGAQPAGARDTVVFLLLDELNASSAGPIVEALAKAGRGVRIKSLVPVGDATAKVVPAMFAGGRFPDAKPCSIATVCSGGRVLDFSKVIASRPDVDVVGFYEPYCKISGLRSCVQAFPSSPALEAERWWCAALRRSVWLSNKAGAAADNRCAALGGETWSALATRIEQGIDAARVWREGGFLFAHVPLPHPPGEGGGEPLSTHYANNISRAVRLVDRVVAEVTREPDRRFTIVVFSDHPLRSSVWCNTTQYRRNGCPLPQWLVDDKVPLIVAGDVPPAFDEIQQNNEVFRLSSR
ncbi:hypothetical protein [Rhizobacter sp. P5_C2]